jgi:hypothetical protein
VRCDMVARGVVGAANNSRQSSGRRRLEVRMSKKVSAFIRESG